MSPRGLVSVLYRKEPSGPPRELAHINDDGLSLATAQRRFPRRLPMEKFAETAGSKPFKERMEEFFIRNLMFAINKRALPNALLDEKMRQLSLQEPTWRNLKDAAQALIEEGRMQELLDAKVIKQWPVCGYWRDRNNRAIWMNELAMELGKKTEELRCTDFTTNGLGGIYLSYFTRPEIRAGDLKLAHEMTVTDLRVQFPDLPKSGPNEVA